MKEFFIVAKPEDFPHCKYLESFVIFEDNNLFVPVGGMKKWKILENENRVIVVIGTRELEGLYGMGIGIKIIEKQKYFKI